MSVVSNNILAGASGQGGAGYAIERSLRFNASDSAHLSRTPSAAGNRKTWTWSGWVKRSTLGMKVMFGHYQTSSSPYGAYIGFVSDQLTFVSNPIADVRTTRLFRDTSAWYHIMVAVDTTQSTANDRVKMYVNGVRETIFSTQTNPTQNADTEINKAIEHTIGQMKPIGFYFDGNLADVHFIDGQALAPTDFGETDDNGVWQPKKFAGTYSDTFSSEMSSISSGNVFPANGTSTINALDGSTSTALDCRRGTHSGTTSIRFTPSSAIANVTKIRVWSNFANKYEINGGGYNTFTSNGSWAEIYNGSAISLTELTVIRDSGNAGADYGHQLHAIEINDVILTRSGGNNSFHLDFADNSSNAALGTDTSGNSNTWTVNNLTGPGGTVDYVSMMTQGSDGGYVLGPERAFDGDLTTFVYTSASNNNGNITFTPSPAISHTTSVRAYWSRGSISATYSYNGGSSVSLTTNGWITLASGSGTFTSLNTYRGGDGNYFSAIEVDGTVLLTSTGANNDSLVDTPTNGTQTDTGAGGEVVGNYATLNPLEKHADITLSNGNLEATTSSNWKSVLSTFGMPSGKWYWELTVDNIAQIGVCGNNTDRLGSYLESDPTAWVLQTDAGNVYTGASGSVSTGVAWAAGDIVNIAYDRDTTSIWFGKNGTWVLSGNPAGGTNAVATNAGPGSTGRTMMVGLSVNTSSGGSINFGQRAFAYAAPSGYKSLNTANLPTPTIADGSLYFDTKLYTGNGGTQALTMPNSAMSPDFVWLKERSTTGDHELFDSVRGVHKYLESNSTNAESTSTTTLTSFNSNGFTLGSSSLVNDNNVTYAGWAWDAGSSTVSNTDGSITSQVRANQSAGFSIVSYTGNSVQGASYGHGLNSVPGMIISKSTDTSQWAVYHQSLGANHTLVLEDSAAVNTSWNDVWPSVPTSSVVNIGSWNAVNDNGETMVAYCFAPVEGYSSMGSYQGNGNADGPFVYTGFKVAWIMIRPVSGGNWAILDTARDPDNGAGHFLLPNDSGAELDYSSSYPNDILSNGFKVRNVGGQTNTNGQEHVYLAFASNPFASNGGLAR